VSDLIIIAHDGAPCFPPEIPACGGVLVFAPDPAGSKFWIAEATQEQADYITQYPFFTLFKGEAKAFTLSDLTGAAFLHNTRVLMAGLAAEQGTPATATGNLTRAFVGKLFDRLALSARSRESIRTVCKVVNELDLRPLHLARVVAECAGLLARRNKRFQLTKAGRELLPDEQVGALYRRLFVAYFRRFDLRYNSHLRDVPLIQQSFAVILWRLDTVARDWTPVRGLARYILLRAVFEQLLACCGGIGLELTHEITGPRQLLSCTCLYRGARCVDFRLQLHDLRMSWPHGRTGFRQFVLQGIEFGVQGRHFR